MGFYLPRRYLEQKMSGTCIYAAYLLEKWGQLCLSLERASVFAAACLQRGLRGASCESSCITDKISTVQSSRRNICNRLMRDCGTELVSEEMRWQRQLMNLTLRCYYCLFLHCAGALCSCLHSPARTTCWHSVASAIPPNNSARHLKHILSVSSVSYDTSQLIS